MNKKFNKNQFKTSDLSLMAFLHLYGYQIEEIDKSNPSKFLFCVKNDDNLPELVNKFWSKKLSVEPLSYFESIKFIKARIYN